MLKLIKIMPMDLLYSFVLAVSGFAIGFVGGMVGLVLGVVRFPVVMNVEPSLSITAGTNLGVSTLGAITASIRHYRQRNIQLRTFTVLAATGAVWSISRFVLDWLYSSTSLAYGDRSNCSV